MSNKIAILKKENYDYPTKDTLYRPDEKYEEYPFKLLSASNSIYQQVRETFYLMGLDASHYNTPKWNPLKEVINPGDNVLIKPNMVMDENLIKENGTDCLYTNPSVVATVIDYVWIALKGQGKITVGDAPMQECKFEKLILESGYKDIIEWYKGQGLPIEIVDFRGLTSEIKNGLRDQKINEDSHGKIIDLGLDSEFASIHNHRDLRITNYNPKILATHHTDYKNEYFVSDYILNADVIINMPKPKSHRKAGLTAAMKNFIGINVRKEYLPHHSQGSKAEGGDEYLTKHLGHRLSSYFLDKRNISIAKNNRMAAQVFRCLNKLVCTILPYQDYSEGSWYGNNTISKTICDLNKIVLYCDKNGTMREELQRKIFIVADMIVMGEKEGPVAPDPKNVGAIAMGDNQVLFDEAIAEYVGYDRQKLPYLVNARNVIGKYKLVNEDEKPEVISNKMLEQIHLEPTSGWKGHIEK